MAYRQEKQGIATQKWRSKPSNSGWATHVVHKGICRQYTTFKKQRKRNIEPESSEIQPSTSTDFNINGGREIEAARNRKEGKWNLVVPSKSGGCSAVASNDGGRTSSTLQKLGDRNNQIHQQKRMREKAMKIHFLSPQYSLGSHGWFFETSLWGDWEVWFVGSLRVLIYSESEGANASSDWEVATSARPKKNREEKNKKRKKNRKHWRMECLNLDPRTVGNQEFIFDQYF